MARLHQLGFKAAIRVLLTSSAFLGMLHCNRAWSAPQTAPDAELTRKIDRFISQLDDENFQVREDAETALRELGDKAIEQLTKATLSKSAEVRLRAGVILRDLRRAALGLRHIGTIQRDDLLGVCGITTSSDGKFFYAAALQASTLVVFRRDLTTGSLAHLQTVIDPANLDGVVCIKLSPDGKLAAATTYRAGKISLLARDPDAGTLKFLNVIGPELGEGNLLQRPVDVVFSPDGKHVYAVDGPAAGVAVFEVTGDGRLKWLQFSKGRDDCLVGARSVAVGLDGKTLVVTSNRAGTLSVLDRDAATGKVELRQVLRDDNGQVTALMGVHGIVLSPDGRHAYVSVGRHLGDQAVGAYRFEKDGTLALVQELVNNKSDLVDCEGANGLYVSPDGLNLYVCGTNTQSLACFNRNLTTGGLSFVATLRNETTGAGVAVGAADVDTSPDGRFVHVALEGQGAISIFERTVKK